MISAFPTSYSSFIFIYLIINNKIIPTCNNRGKLFNKKLNYNTNDKLIDTKLNDFFLLFIINLSL